MASDTVAAWALPQGWETISLGSMVQIKSGFACAKRNLVSAEEGIAHLRPFNVDTKGHVDLSEVYYIPRDYKDSVEDYALEPGHVLLNNTNSAELVGKTALVREPLECAFSNHIYRLTVKSQAKARLEPAWLALALRRLWADGYFEERCNRWIGQAGFNSKKLRVVDIPLPSLEEQRRIVERIEELSARIEEARRLRSVASKEVERLMDAAMAQVFHDPDDRLPEGWGWHRLSEVCEINPRKPGVERDGNAPTSFVPMAAVDDERGEITNMEVEPYDEVKRGYTYFEEDDVLFAKITPSLENGKSAVARGLIDGIGFGSTEFHRLRPGEKVIPEWVHLFIRQRSFRDEAASHFRGSVGQQRVPKEFLETHLIPIPPIDEQRGIAQYLIGLQARVQSLKGAQERAETEIDDLEQSILARAFRGEL